MYHRRKLSKLFLILIFSISPFSFAQDLDEIKRSGVLRHIGVPYANFIAYIHGNDYQSVSGLDVDLVKGFAQWLGVRYQYVPATWNNAIGKLTGKDIQYFNNQFHIGDKVDIEGDIIANGMTILDWRSQLIDFSDDYFPSAVWLVSVTNSTLRPIKPSGSLQDDIQTVRNLIKGRDVLALEYSCLDPNLYNLYETEANVVLPSEERNLNEMVPAILNNDAESTLLDVPDTLIALEKWPGKIKVIGPVSEEQTMAAAFRKDSPKLRAAFNEYLQIIKKDGRYQKLVEKYYPSVFDFYQDYFNGILSTS
ncbi:transporter substrate-binding domain-containing protein [Vibrio aphrogenes]|uniref:transporter substrate-binding domain-containing protein n=1 Tax=Vibrio aphrogenes TaxID=1891186 RepID=UPI000B359621|nr:transporter substrate-binding domain-containing protein [Vibrio aphrogenes]